MTLPKLAALDDKLKLRVLMALALALAGVAVVTVWALLKFQPLGVDLLPLWTAGRMAWTAPAHVYNFAVVTRAQDWLLGDLRWPRPYVYPPTALLLLAPFGALPFWPALALWTAASFGVFLTAAARLVRAGKPVAMALIVLSPTVVLAMLAGQTVILAAGLATLAVTDLERRPRLAGAFLAMAVALKPQAVLLAPVALVACGALETLVAAAITGVALAALSVVCFGFARWPEWLASLGAFQAVVEGIPTLMAGVITPYGAAHELGLSGPAAMLWRGAFATAGLCLVWRVFARTRDPAPRLAALGAGSLMAAPYAMLYDGILLVIPAVVMALRFEAPAWRRNLLAFCVICQAGTPNLGLAAIVVFAALACWDLLPTRLGSGAVVARA